MQGDQPLLQRFAHGDQAVGTFIQAVADRLSHPAHKMIFDRQHTVQIFGPEVQHIVGKGDFVLFGVFYGWPAHQYRAGIEAEHRIVSAGQAFQRCGGVKRPTDVV